MKQLACGFESETLWFPIDSDYQMQIDHCCQLLKHNSMKIFYMSGRKVWF